MSGRLKTAVLLATGLVYAGTHVDGQGAFASPGTRTSSGGSAAPLQVPASVMAALLVSRVKPEVLTKGVEVTGQVVVAIRVSPDGNVEKATAVSGPEALRSSALFAVRQFIYKPYRVNGQPMEVETTVSVDFSDGKAVSPVVPANAGARQAFSTGGEGSSISNPASTPVIAKPAISSGNADGVSWVKMRPDGAQPVAGPRVTSAVAPSTPVAKAPMVAEAASTALAKPAPVSRAYVPPAPAPARSPAPLAVPAAAEPVVATYAGTTQWRLVKRVAPLYPAQAELEGIEGVVVVQAVVRKDGSLRELQAVSGPPELRQAAVDAASQFEYAPVGGIRPTGEGTTTTSVEFVLKGPAKVPAEVMAGRIEHNVTPLYPPAAEAAGITGAVTLHVLIDREGKVETAEAIDGPMALRETALEAVKQWTWKPYLRRGVDVEVDTTVIMAFSLQRAGQQ
jgi:TonB family protein